MAGRPCNPLTIQLDGPNEIMEIDESKFFQWKYYCRVPGLDHWVLGMVQRKCTAACIVKVPDCSASTLLPIIRQHVLPGTRIITDGWAAYNQLLLHEMASGVQCTQDCVDQFNELKLRKNHRYILYGIVNNDKEIGIVKCAPRDATYDDFMTDLLEASSNGHGRYAVYDYEAPAKNATLVFVVWTPSNIGVRYKMLYASSKDAIKRKLIGIKRELEANDLDEITEEELRKKAE